MEMYCTTSGIGEVKMIYLGTSIKEAIAKVGPYWKRYQRPDEEHPEAYRSLYTALPRDIDVEFVRFYEAGGCWFSVVNFRMDAPRKV